jgi:hypothetical protein
MPKLLPRRRPLTIGMEVTARLLARIFNTDPPWHDDIVEIVTFAVEFCDLFTRILVAVPLQRGSAVWRGGWEG